MVKIKLYYYSIIMSDLQFIQLNERAYRYIRQFSIKSAEDALTELLTNCIDAYNKTTSSNRVVDIAYFQNVLSVRDYAIGLNAEQMSNCFLQVGNYTNSEGSRGFFSRGAKDISAIGNIEFHSIKNNLYSKVILNNEAYGKVEISDIEATSEIRTLIGIPKNGLLVNLALLDNFKIQSIPAFIDSITKLAVLRIILSDNNNIINFSSDEISTRIQYIYPEGNILLDLTYVVPGYNVSAQFKVYKASKAIDQPKKESEMQFGFLIKDDSTVYEVGTIDDRFRWNPYMPFVYGELYCKNINTLLYEYDTLGATPTNPVPIIDPSRLTGTNKNHPFIIALLSIPKVRLDQILRELNSSISQQSISLSEISELFNELEKYGLNIIEDREVKVNFVPSYDSNLAKAIQDDRMNYVTAEKNYMVGGDLNEMQTETDKYVEEQIRSFIAANPEALTSSFIMSNIGETSLDFTLMNVPSGNSNDIFASINTLGPDVLSALRVHPYIYRINDMNRLTKIYIYSKGTFEEVVNPEEEGLSIKNKKFKILFINDINITKRYTIDYDDGVTIKLNLNDQIIKKYIADSGSEEVLIEDISSTRSLIFLKEMMIDIISSIITESDTMNGKVILDSGNFNNARRLLDYFDNLVSKVQQPIENIFQKYIDKNISKKNATLSNIIQTISTMVATKINMETEGLELTALKEHLNETLGKLIE
jgi:hypothetical protein